MKLNSLLSPITAACVVAVLVGCSTVRQIKPLDPGASSVNLSVGGPFTELFGVFIPLPLLSLGYNYGLTHTLDAEAGLGITQALYGIGELNLGVNYRPLMPKGWAPGLIVSPSLFLAEDISPLTEFTAKNFRCYPYLGLTAWWNRDGWWRPYISFESWFDLGSTRADSLPQQDHWLIAPAGGIDMESGKWHYQIKIELYTPNLRNWGRAAHFFGPGDKGVFGLFLGVGREFGGKK